MSISIIDVPQLSGVKPTTTCSWLTVLPRLAKHQIVRIMERRRLRRSADALLAMDDRILADIGLHRCEVAYAARYGRRPADEDRRRQ
jgi:uncharacterized protein YjiS (DUF1127 family)